MNGIAGTKKPFGHRRLLEISGNVRQRVGALRRRARGRCPGPRAESRPFGFDP